MKNDIITLGYGSGAALTRQLIREVFVSKFRLPTLDDAACIDNHLTVTTDAYVVNPLFFPGGDIGKLSITGTVNDLSMNGSVPAYLVASFILEEGFSINLLKRIVDSMQKTAEEAGVQIIAGDTKVVEKGKCDGVYITTTGIGFLPEGIDLNVKNIKAGDRIVVNGSLGDHAVAIINARQKLGLDPAPISDCAPLREVIEILLNTTKLRFARDATRGGVATILNEIYEDTGLGVILDETSLPIKDSTTVLCGLLGLDPLYLANEGKLVAVVSEANDDMLIQLKAHRYGQDSAIIGEVTKDVNGVYLRTALGSLRPLLMLASDPLPRIC
ncbi:MAG: hydrogenase expression/formation protein HypE [Candidatus Cloacimonadaceae bacterium]|nr:hydrogenase expression/formation protein HypE [Candidatus Cloacimonadaceae bacterium]MDP3113422.1 hydrogenase expression/formation protein HypE [Candidatus Cloacimonadaceae bacterium]